MDASIPKPSNQTDNTGKAPETSSSALEPVLDKYRDEYHKKTAEEYSLLYSILKDPNAKIDDQIRASWDENDQIKSNSRELGRAMEQSYNRFLKSFVLDLKEDEKDTVTQRNQIIEGMRRLKFFKYDLILKIKYLKIQTDQPADSSSSSEQIKQIELAQAAARCIVEDVIEGRINILVASRRDAIKTYEGALIFLAEATQQRE